LYPIKMVAFSKLAVTAVLSGLTYGHTIFQEVWVNGVDQGHEVGVRVPSYDGPIYDVTSPDIICNGGASNSGLNKLNTPFPTNIINVPSGGQVTLEWHHTLAGADPSDSADPIDPGHKGPVLAYLAAVPSALQTDVTGLKWFKVYHDGYISSSQTWGVDRLYANKGKVSFTLPSCIPPGNYFLRGEVIALHGASSKNGAQFYMECAQINIVGGGAASPSAVSFPGAYNANDPGILIDIYYPTVTSYTIPGPTVFTCPGGGSGSPPTTSSPAAVPTTFTTVKPITTSAIPTTSSVAKSTTTSSKTTTTSSATSPTATGQAGAAYAQCGGATWTGSTTCVSTCTCTVLNSYYSQCIPK